MPLIPCLRGVFSPFIWLRTPSGARSRQPIPSGESTLRPAAVLKLNDVATALTTGNPESTITVEGHTDAQGQRAFNMDLAQKRANAVREQLVARGVAGDRIKAVGVGPDKPVASNDNAEGRANNRRVEIVVQNK